MSQNILDTIAAATIERVAAVKEIISAVDMKRKALAMGTATSFPFEKALQSFDIAFICECKKASPSKGVIAENFPYLQIAKEYEQAGAAAISVLTEPKWFMGSNEILHPFGVDVSSGVETAGYKDYEKMKRFVEICRENDD